MFARSGSGGGDDDAYNFDIANSYGGSGRGASKQSRSKQSKLGKSLLSKTTGSSPSSSSFKPHEAPSGSLVPVINMDSKAPLRASAPAAPTSALDKAMSFLNKYKEGGSSTPRSSTAEGANIYRGSGAANTFLDENEMDMSLSSDSDKYLKTTRKAKFRLTPSRDTPAAEHGEGIAVAHEGGGVSRSLTGARSSVHFATARELGMLDSGALGGPKAAVSPAGLERPKPSSGSKENTLYQSGGYPPPDGRSAGIGASAVVSASPNADAVRQSSEYDSEGEVASRIESVSSMVPAAVDELRVEARATDTEQKRRGSFLEIGSGFGTNAQRISGFLRQSVEQESKLLPNRQKSGLCSSPVGEASDVDSGYSRAESTPRSSMPMDELASVSDHKVAPISKREADGPDGGGTCSRELIREGVSASHAEAENEAEDGEDDDYEDDDFEELDTLLESDVGGAVSQPLHLAASKGRDRSGGLEAAMLPQTKSRAHQPPQIRGTKMENQTPEPAAAVSSVAVSPLEQEVGRSRQLGAIQEPRQAWDDLSAELKRGLPDTTDFGTSPESDTDGNAEDISEIAPGKNVDIRKPRLGVEERQTRRSLGGCWVDVASGAHDSEPTKGTDDGTAPILAGKITWDETQGANAESRKMGATDIDGISKRGVLIDRSTEVREPGRPPGMEVKTISRASGVASVEYAHDTERGVDLRSYGTQAVGSSAAVQVNIAVPGMVGTESAVGTGHRTSGTQIGGVGYKQGEPYAKWGRFACEMPANYRNTDRGPEANSGASAERSSSRTTPSRRRSRPTNEFCPTGMTGLEVDGAGVGVRGNVSAGPESTRGEVAQPKDYEGMQGLGPRGAPAYLQTFFAAMAKSQSDNCSAWRQALEATAPVQQRFPSPDEGSGFTATKTTTHGAEGTEHGAERSEPLSFDAGGNTQERRGGPIEFDQDIYGIMTATQDSFRRQLADMRDNLNKVRYRAEVAGRQGYAHNYESVAGAHEFLDKVRPRATSQAKALVAVDPSLSLQEAEALADESGTVPSSPIEPHPNRAREPDGVEGS